MLPGYIVNHINIRVHTVPVRNVGFPNRHRSDSDLSENVSSADRTGTLGSVSERFCRKENAPSCSFAYFFRMTRKVTEM